MKRKLLVALLLAFIAISSVWASPWNFVFGDLDQNSEILMGFVPSYLLAGAEYDGFSFVNGYKTGFQVLAGGGYNNRKMWQDPTTGSPIYEDPLIYNYVDVELSLRFVQGFLNSPVKGKNLFYLTASYDGRYEAAYDSLNVGKEKLNGAVNPVLSISDFLGANPSGDHQYTGSVYSTLAGNRKFLGNSLGLTLKMDAMKDTLFTTDGFVAYVKTQYGPYQLNSALDGYADYFALTANGVGAFTAYKYQSEKQRWFSIVFIDRVNFSWVTGKAVPPYISGPASLGRKARGFNTFTYDKDFSMINNFDIRLCGPDMGVKGIAPRINLFYDLGFAWGDYINSSYNDGISAVSSTGVQATISFFDFIDLGYQIAYLITGRNYTQGTEKWSCVGSVTFFLDF